MPNATTKSPRYVKNTEMTGHTLPVVYYFCKKFCASPGQFANYIKVCGQR